MLNQATVAHQTLRAKDRLAAPACRGPSSALTVRTSVESRSWFEVGGDFHGVDQEAPGVVTAFIGDVSGKGAGAAALAQLVARELTSQLITSRSPGAALAAANDWLEAQALHDQFASLACVRLDLRLGTASLASAGHLCPLLRRPGRCRSLGQPAGPPLGVLRGLRYEETRFSIEAGDLLLFVTDGISDAFAHPRDPLGEDGLMGVIVDGPPSAAAMVQTLMAAAHGRVADDATVLGLEIAPIVDA